MTRSTRSASKARRPARAAATPVTARNVLLAGLGAVALGRRQAAQAVEALAAAPESLRERACAAAGQARREVEKLRKQAEKKMAPLRKQALAFADQAQAEFEARLQPVLVRFGLADTPARARRRPAAKKASRRPAARQAAKRARRA